MENKNKINLMIMALMMFIILPMQTHAVTEVGVDPLEQEFVDLLLTESILSPISKISAPSLSNLTPELSSASHGILFTNQPILVTFFSPLGGDITINYGAISGDQQITLIPDEEYNVFLFQEFEGEKINLVVSGVTNIITYTFTTYNDDQRGAESRFTIFSPMIEGIQDIITININLWKILYYLVLTLIFVGSIVLLFWAGFKIINKSKEINNSEGMLSEGRGR